jgi:polysaccharide deacetylase family protein (PEP-CTERM system associated)
LPIWSWLTLTVVDTTMSSPSQAEPSPRSASDKLENGPLTRDSTQLASGQRLSAFSVDVEDYFHVEAFAGIVSRSDWEQFEPRVERNTQRLLELLDRHEVKATFFVLGWVAERFPQLVREMAAQGHEVSAHGYDHRPITDQTRGEFRADVRRSKQILEDIVGVEVPGYRAPTYSIVRDTLWALDVLKQEGYRYDSSIFPILHDRYGIPTAGRFPGKVPTEEGASLLEFPISTVRVLGTNLPFIGGGYLRHCPLRFILWGMRRVNMVERQPVMLYVHPWEIDPDQPSLSAGPLTRFRHYRNLDKTERRLDLLLDRFHFTTVRKVLGL